MNGSQSEIAMTRDGAVATMTINRPEELNRLSPEATHALSDAVEGLAGDGTCHAVLLTGTGSDWFSAGFLNPEIRGAMSKDEVVDFVLFANGVLDRLESMPQIVICAINGNIVAGAVEIALACDIRLAADHATLAMPEAKWGGFPGAGGPVRLPMIAGHGRAMELICTGREIGAAEMLEYGLVEHVYPAANLLAAARDMANSIAANGPLATRGAKRISQTRRSAGFAAARELSDTLRRELEWSHDVDEGMAAHRENRTAKFVGR